MNGEKPMEHITYAPRGVCSRRIDIDIDKDVIVNAEFVGGCSGNTQGLCALLKGMDVNDAVKRLEGIRCGLRPTSCPDQLALALKGYLANKK